MPVSLEKGCTIRKKSAILFKIHLFMPLIFRHSARFSVSLTGLLSLLVGSCASAQLPSTRTADPDATPETVTLCQNLRANTQHLMFGHQDDLAYGVTWKYEAGRSDVKDACGDYPAVYGWDLGGMENKSNKNIDGIPFTLMRQYIIDGHKRGAVITLSWHMNNPLTGGNAWDTTQGSLVSALPGGPAHSTFTAWLDNAAAWLLTLKDAEGHPIPILFRPFHELTGDWFWWCRNNGSPSDFQLLWKFTFDYLRQKGVHNLLYVYNTSNFDSEGLFRAYYPGRAYADMLSFDHYQMEGPNSRQAFIDVVRSQLAIMSKVAQKEDLPMALAETGYEAVPDPSWWTGTLMEAIGDYPLSYVLVWRNHGWNEYLNPPRMHYYAPYRGQVSESDFKAFRTLGRTWFEKDAAAAKLYQKH